MSFSPQAKAMDLIFRENFANATSVARSGGTINGNPTIGSMKGVFDGTGDYISYDSINFERQSKGSVVARIEPASLGNYNTVIGIGGSNVVSPGVFLPVGTYDLAGSKYFHIQYKVEGGALNQVRSTQTVSPNTRYHIVVTSDGSTWKMYINGVEETLVLTHGANNGGWFSDLSLTNPQVLIGGIYYDGFYANLYNGSVSDIYISSREWTAQEALDDYQGTTFSYMDRAVLDCRFQDKTGTDPYYTTDLSKVGNTIQLGNGVAPATYPTKDPQRNGYTSAVGDYLRCIGSPFYNYGSAISKFTVFAWVDAQRASFNGTLWTVMDTAELFLTGNLGFYLMLDDRGGSGVNNVMFGCRTVSNTYRGGWNATNTIQSGLNFVCATYDGTTNPGTVRVCNGENLLPAVATFGTGYGNFRPRDYNVGMLATSAAAYARAGSILRAGMILTDITPTQAKDIYHKGPHYRGNL